MNTNYKALAQDTAIRELHLHQFQEQATPRNETPLQPQGTTEGEGPQASWRIHWLQIKTVTASQPERKGRQWTDKSEWHQS